MSPEPRFVEIAPLKPFNIFFFNTILMMPELPSGSYFAEGLVTISIRSIEPAGKASKRVLPFAPDIELGLPSIKIVTVPSPRSEILPSWSSSTEGKRVKISFAVPPLTVKSSETLYIFLSHI